EPGGVTLSPGTLLRVVQVERSRHYELGLPWGDFTEVWVVVSGGPSAGMVFSTGIGSPEGTHLTEMLPVAPYAPGWPAGGATTRPLDVKMLAAALHDS